MPELGLLYFHHLTGKTAKPYKTINVEVFQSQIILEFTSTEFYLRA